MRISWQKFKSSDSDDLLRMMEHFARVASLPWNPEKRRQNIADFKQGEIWFVVMDGKKIGYVVNVFGFSFEFGGRVAFIDEFYIEQSHQRSGIGRQTLDFISKDAAGKGFEVVFLEASDSEKHLHTFYEKSGFVRRDYRLYYRMLKAD